MISSLSVRHGRKWMTQHFLRPRSAAASTTATTTTSMMDENATHFSKINDKNSTTARDAAAVSKRGPPDFTNARIAFAHQSNLGLLRAIGVYRLCNLPFLLPHANQLLQTSRLVLGNRLTDSLLKASLFGHFCAGETEQEIYPALQHLHKYRVRGILDYAAEADLPQQPQQQEEETTTTTTTIDEIEAASDCHLEHFRSCIRSAHKASPDGFAAIKVTALGNPHILQRMSTAIVEAQNLLAKFDVNNDGVVTRQEFEQGYRLFFKDADDKLPGLLEYLDPDMTGSVDYITWCKLLSPRDLPEITANCRNPNGPLSQATLTNDELDLMEAMMERAHSLAAEAVRCGTRVMIDAEQVRFQPAIDNLVLELQQKYNSTNDTDRPIVFNTYQCYLQDTASRLRVDIARSERFSYHFGAKLVRGAYLESERALAQEMGYPSPIHETLDDTHACYNDSVEFLMRHSQKTDQQVELVCATHNQESIEKAIGLMEELGVDKSDGPVHFAQLLGMSDNLTFNLGAHGYQAYKYVPYGKVEEAVPYLLRRAEENSAIAGSATRELALLMDEATRRVQQSRLFTFSS